MCVCMYIYVCVCMCVFNVCVCVCVCVCVQLVQLFGKQASCSAVMSALLQQLHTLSLPFFQSGMKLQSF